MSRALWIILLVQLGVVLLRAGPSPVDVDLQVGEVLPFKERPIVPTESVPLAGRGLGGIGCRVAFVCTTACRACGELARKQALERGVGGALDRSVFLVYGGWEEVVAWTRLQGLLPERVYQISPIRHGSLDRPIRGRLWFTPMRLITDSEGRVRDFRPSDEAPYEEELLQLCENGGISPRSLDEFVASLPAEQRVAIERDLVEARRRGESAGGR